jgi:hypothetical protein
VIHLHYGGEVAFLKPMSMSDLESRVSSLSYGDLVEAANFYLPEAVGTADLEEVEHRLVAEVQQRGGQYLELKERLKDVEEDAHSIEYLLRGVLLHAARGSELDQQRLTEALDGVGQNQVIVEVVYAICAATVLGIVWILKPPREEHVKTKRETRPDGSQVETVETKVKEAPLPIDKLYAWIKNLKGAGSS